jgi:hypothetical protein
MGGPACRQVVVAVRARCGYLCVLTMPLVPDKPVCRRLAQDYEYAAKESLQFNLD